VEKGSDPFSGGQNWKIKLKSWTVIILSNDESTEFQFEEIRVRQGAKLANVNLMDSGIRQEMNLIVIAIQDKNGEMMFNPKADTKFVIGDTIVVMGSAKSIKKLEVLMQG